MKLKHKSGGRSIEVADSDAGPYLTQGWAEVEKKAPARSSTTKDDDKS